jgi:ATP-dependent protease HslVU (ClpYQ) peptidase subunit
MTTVAWDGERLAADRLAAIGDTAFYTQKVYKLRGHLVSFTGVQAAGVALMHWFADGADPSKFPADAKTDTFWARLIVIPPNGPVRTYEGLGHPCEFDRARYAAGTGAQFALTAMYLGKTAGEAVEVACALSHTSRGGWTSRTFEDPDDVLNP